jgi:hypothetical protein
MAACNAGPYIGQAIESVLAQTFQAWELIVVDDGSTDDTAEMVRLYAARDARIRYHRNHTNLGLGPTRRRTLAAARGRYAAVLDADDVALPEWLDRRVRLLDADPDVVLASGSRIIVDQSNRRLGVSRDGSLPEVLQWQLLFGNPINNSSSVFGATEARSVGGYRDHPYLEDWSLFARLSGIGRIVQQQSPSVMYRVHSSNTSTAIGTNQALTAPISGRIIAETVERETGLTVPGELAWLLYRGRGPSPAGREECRRALDFLLLALHEYLKRVPGECHAPVAAAALHDAANVLRCGTWSLEQGWKALRAIVGRGGVRSLAWATGGTRGALKLLLPYPGLKASWRGQR